MANYLEPYAAELQGIQRQQKLADMLMQQGQQQPQEQIIGGRVMRTNPLAQLVPLLNTYQGQNLSENAQMDTKKLAELVRGETNTKNQAIIDAMLGKDYQPAIAPEIQRDDMGNVMPNVQEQSGMKADPRQALKLAASGQSPFAQGATSVLLQNMFKEDTPMILPEGGTAINRKGEVIAQGSSKYHAPIQIDAGTHIDLVDPITMKVISRTPKSQMPTAGQVVETANGPMLVNTRTGLGSPITMNGQTIPPKLSSEQTKDIVGINQQRSTIEGAIKTVEDMPSAFSIGRGMAQSLPLGETIAGRFDTPEEAQARAYVFNNVSSIIKERAGAAQSKQELSRLNSFLPSKDDGSQQIINKLKGFNQFLTDQEKGTRINPNVPTINTPNAQPDYSELAKQELARRKK